MNEKLGSLSETSQVKENIALISCNPQWVLLPIMLVSCYYFRLRWCQTARPRLVIFHEN